MRTVAALACFSLALALLFHFAKAVPVVWPTLRQMGQEPTTYWVLRIGGLSLSGSQLLVFEGIVLLTSIGLIGCALLVARR